MHLCMTPGCGHARRRRSRYCSHHARRLNSYANPLGRPLPIPWLVSYATAARRVLDGNPEHAGLRAASAELDRLFSESRRAASVKSTDPLHIHFGRLSAHGVTPVDVIAMYAAVALYDREHPRDLRDATMFRFAVARAVCGLVPRQGIVLRSRALDRIGRYVTERYAGLAAGIVTAVEQAETNEQQRSAVMSAPFNIPQQCAPSSTDPAAVLSRPKRLPMALDLSPNLLGVRSSSRQPSRRSPMRRLMVGMSFGCIGTSRRPAAVLASDTLNALACRSTSVTLRAHNSSIRAPDHMPNSIKSASSWSPSVLARFLSATT